MALRLSEGLGSNATQRPRRNFAQGSQDCRHGERQVLKAIAFRSHYDDRNREGILILLILHALVGREQDIEVILGQREQLAVLGAGLALSLNGAA